MICERCHQKTPCACTPYNAIREKGEPGDQGANAALPTFTATVIQGPPGVTINDTDPLNPALQYSQPAPDTSLDYTWFGTNTFTGTVIINAPLVVTQGTGPGDTTGLFFPGSTVTTTLVVTGSTQLSGTTLFQNVPFTVETIDSEGFVYFSGPTNFGNLTINGPLVFNGTADFSSVTISVDPFPQSVITGSTKIAFQAYVEPCGETRSGNVGIIAQQLRLTPHYPFSTSPVPGDAQEHPLFYSQVFIGAPDCGLEQSANADMMAFIDIGNWVTSFGDRWTIRMRADNPIDGDILDSFRFYTYGIGVSNWATLRVLLRNIAVPVATGVNNIYFTAQSDNMGVDDLSVLTDNPRLTVQ
jgi:hypothetical protein